MTIVFQRFSLKIQVKYLDTEYKWYWFYEYKDEFWEGFGFDSEKEALEYGIKYVRSQLLAENAVADASSRLEQLNCADQKE
jgi:hypothetical protein